MLGGISWNSSNITKNYCKDCTAGQCLNNDPKGPKDCLFVACYKISSNKKNKRSLKEKISLNPKSNQDLSDLIIISFLHIGIDETGNF